MTFSHQQFQPNQSSGTADGTSPGLQQGPKPDSFYRTLFDSIDEGFYLGEIVCDEAGRPVDIRYHDENPAAVRLIGQSARGRLLSELDAHFEQYWCETFGHTARTGQAQRLEKYVAPYGIWISFYVFKPEGVADSSSFGLLFQNVTARKNAEDALQKSFARNVEILESISDAFYALDSNSCFIYINKKAEELWGRSREELIGKHFWTEFPAAVGSHSYSMHLQAMAQRQVVHYETESPLLHRWIDVSLYPDALGGLSCYFRDIAERKQREADLRQLQEHLAVIFEEAAVGLSEITLDGRFRRVNNEMCRIVGRSRNELVGLSVAEVTFPEDRIATMLSVERILNGGEPESFDKRYLRGDGSIVWANSTVALLQDQQGAAWGLLAVTVDLTLRRQAEAALQRARDELEVRVEERTAQLRAEAEQRQRAEEVREQLLRRVVTAQEEERQRIARELHDQMGQQLTALLIGMAALPQDVGPQLPSYNRQLKDLQNLATQIMEEMHNLAWELRPPALDNIGLEAALQQHLQQWSRKSGIQTDLVSRGVAVAGSSTMPVASKDGAEPAQELRQPTDVETALYRVVQEALTNVQKHAGARNVSVILERRGPDVIAIVEDDGRGFDVQQDESGSPVPVAHRLGLLGMMERLDLVGGTLTIESAPGQGTTVYARVPLERRGAPRD
jgi:PAS domain S-box-containing protein